ncbi:MAG: cobalamin B12-binding domain-containing protein [Candidatus Ranarchaeia archaeon]|jgi:5-methyltetrahydrofolate--homocysteine methyltransferase
MTPNSEESLKNLLINLKEDLLLEAVQQRLTSKIDPMVLINEMRDGMRVVGDKYEDGEYFLGELLVAAEVLNKAIEIIKPHLKKQGDQHKTGTIVIGTVKSDIHAIGKDIVATLLECEGYEVHNIGVDLPPEEFVKKVQETGAQIVGLSTLMTPGIDWMKKTVEAFEDAGLRDSVKIIIGGAVLYGNPKQMMDLIKADEMGRDALEAVQIVRKIIEESHTKEN